MEKYKKINPYENTLSFKKTFNSIINIDDKINLLFPQEAHIKGDSEDINFTFKNHFSHGAENWNKKDIKFIWNIILSQNNKYHIFLIAKGKGKVGISIGNNISEIVIDGEQWNKYEFEMIDIHDNDKEICLFIPDIPEIPIDILAMEIVDRDTHIIEQKKAIAFKTDTEWFADGIYGLMFQWMNRATPKEGKTIKPWEEKVNNFNIDRFVDLVEQSGAKHVMWSVTWGEQYISAPIKALDDIIPGRTTKRDLLGEMIDKLHDKGIKMLFYYHAGYDCYHSIDSKWAEKAGWYKGDKSILFKNIASILSEVGERYGKKLCGWFFDGASRFYNPHSDGSDYSIGIHEAPFEMLSKAARIGNEKRIICYNSWIYPKHTEYQDYFCGEGLSAVENFYFNSFSGKIRGIFPVNHPHTGLRAHTNFPLEKRWGHVDYNTPIEKPNYTVEDIITVLKSAKKNRFVVSINLEMYEDGTVSPDSKRLLKQVRKQFR